MNDIDWDLLIRYLATACTAAEREEVDRWLAASDEHREILDGVRAGLVEADRELSSGEEGAMLASLRREIGATAVETSRPPLRIMDGARPPTVRRTFSVERRSWRSRVRMLGAAAAIVAGTAVLWQFRDRLAPVSEKAAGAAFRETSTALGQQMVLRLSDGTVVALAPGSRLRTPIDYGTTNRTVYLEGQAAFTVTHDARRPFAVHTSRAIARDLGTRFVVRAYPTDTKTDVVVAEGVVAVAHPGTPADSLILVEGDRARVGADGRVVLARAVPLDRYFAWTDGRLAFSETPLGEVVSEVARWYDLDMRIAEPALAARIVSAEFAARSQSAEDVVRALAAAVGARATWSGRVVTFGDSR